MVSAFEKTPNISFRDVAEKVKMSPSFVQKVTISASIKSFTVGVASNRDIKQNKRIYMPKC